MLMRRLVEAILAAAAALGCCLPALAQPGDQNAAVLRTVVALYDRKAEAEPSLTLTHRVLELPLNHLGLRLEYHDVREGLPDLAARPDVRGIVSCYPAFVRFSDPLAYMEWILRLVKAGKKAVVLGNPGWLVNDKGEQTSAARIAKFWQGLGIRDFGRSFDYPRNVQVEMPAMDGRGGFERSLLGEIDSYYQLRAAGPQVRSHLRVRCDSKDESEADMAFTAPWGGWAADGFAFRVISEGPAGKAEYQWYLDPFEFLEAAFDTGGLPKPDPTTLAGRRVFVGIAGGSGLQKKSDVEGYAARGVPAAEVLLERFFKRNQDLPFTVAPIMAELDKNWAGSTRSEKSVARLLALPQVEAGTQGYSAVLDWRMFMRSLLKSAERKRKQQLGRRGRGRTPQPLRIYDQRGISLQDEIEGAARYLNGMLPSGKKAEIMLWTYKTTPSAAALTLAAQAGLRGVRAPQWSFSILSPWLSSLSPFGVPAGDTYLPYVPIGCGAVTPDEIEGSSWLRGCQEAFRLSETPRRLAPLGLRLFFSAGIDDAALEIAARITEAARREETCPVSFGGYHGMVQGFNTLQLVKAAPRGWIVKNRGALQTLRVDKPGEYNVDADASRGIVGQRRYQGSLYVYLDKSEAEPILVLKEGEGASAENRAFLVGSRWPVWSVLRKPEEVSFDTGGLGRMDMTWQLPWSGSVSFVIRSAARPDVIARSGTFLADAEGVASLEIPHMPCRLCRVVLRKGGQP